jgi:membrane-bound serine protease (ClpP class)
VSVIVGGTAVSAGFLLLALAMLVRSRRKAVVTGGAAVIGAVGSVVEWADGEGRVRVSGEVWRARAGVALQPGERVNVRDRDGLTLLVERFEDK